MARCSVPRLLGFDRWFTARFGPLCLEHDRVYMLREGWKLAADWRLCRDMVRRGRRYLPLAALVFLFCQSPVGWVFWWRD